MLILLIHQAKAGPGVRISFPKARKDLTDLECYAQSKPRQDKNSLISAVLCEKTSVYYRSSLVCEFM